MNSVETIIPQLSESNIIKHKAYFPCASFFMHFLVHQPSISGVILYLNKNEKTFKEYTRCTILTSIYFFFNSTITFASLYDILCVRVFTFQPKKMFNFVDYFTFVMKPLIRT